MALWAALGPGCSSFSEPSPICVGGVAVDEGGPCEHGVARDHQIPFRADVDTRVSQAFYGYETHQGDLSYAVDFSCRPGQAVTASRGGVVWGVRQDSNRGCPDDECVEDANYVIIDHGDGTYSSYFHLQHRGAIVETGDEVCAGEVIGVCGSTGFATGTHLHFSVRDTSWRTVPVMFDEVAERSPGVILPREEYRSQNERQSGCDGGTWSTLGRDAFAHRGILLADDLPTVIDEGDSRTWQIEGRYGGELPKVAIHRRAPGESEWMTECVEVEDGGHFSAELQWPASGLSGAFYFFMMTGADEACRAPGWAWAYRVRMLFRGDDEAIDQREDEGAQSRRDEPVRPTP